MEAEAKTKKVRPRLRGKKVSEIGGDEGITAQVKGKKVSAVQIPDEILTDPLLNEAISVLPKNYEFEIHKTVWRLKRAKSKRVALQFPEGLLMYACVISDILEKFAEVETLVMGDVTYGACCVDDFTASALGCDFLVHYGHSCLVPIDVSKINMLYVFVDIKIDVDHFIASVKHNFGPELRVVLAGTIQFQSGINTARLALEEYFTGGLLVPQGKPLSKGEVLGCTSPKFEQGAFDLLLFIADGRFHLESIMIQNPDIPAFYKYDPYNKKLTSEVYHHSEMFTIRKEAIEVAKRAQKFGIILGALGRQGNPKILERLQTLLKAHNLPHITVLLSEIFPSKLDMFPDVGAWIQVACPRLSIDWGYAFNKPLLNSYEATVMLNETNWQDTYPMDFYRHDAGMWGNYFDKDKTGDKSKLEIGYE